MKIGTDAVLLGAWAPCKNETRILDIGTGTGILALMMAQKNIKTEIDAVEIETATAELAEQNIKLSPWHDRIHIFNNSIQDFAVLEPPKYSLIICNPPFFTDSLKAPDAARNTARHNDLMPVSDLLESTSKLLTTKGNTAFIIPADAFANWQLEAKKFSLFPKLLTWVRSSPDHSHHRVMVLFSREHHSEIIENEMCIYSSKNIYSHEYRELTGDFYLKF